MPTPHSVLSAVAHALGGIDPKSRTDVGRFYKYVFTTYPAEAQELVSDWLRSAEHDVDQADIDELVRSVDGLKSVKNNPVAQEPIRLVANG